MPAVNATLARCRLPSDVPTYTDVQRIFNKSCIECHGGLDYPPYRASSADHLDFSEDENPPAGAAARDRAWPFIRHADRR